METIVQIVLGFIGVAIVFILPIIAIGIALFLVLKMAKKKANYLKQRQETQEQILDELKKQNQKL